MSIYCILEFLEDKDLTEINTKRFNEEIEAKHPQISLCHRSFLNDKLKELNEDIDANSYSKFLYGYIWDDRMVNLSIDETFVKLEDYIIDSCVQSRLGGACETKGKFFNWILLSGYKCLSFQYPELEKIEMASLWIKSSIFESRIISDIQVLISFPYQIMNAAAEFPLVIRNSSSSKGYGYSIMINGVEFTKRRNKSKNPCLEVDKFEFDVISESEILSFIGCRPFYLNRIKKHPPCDSQEKMSAVFKRTMKLLSDDNKLTSMDPPCTEIDKISYQDSLTEVDNDTEIGWFKDTKKSLQNHSSWVRISVIYQKQTYREIKQVRAYTVQSLVGNVGGYVGLFVGYSLLQLPDLFRNICNIFKNRWNYSAQP